MLLICISQRGSISARARRCSSSQTSSGEWGVSIVCAGAVLIEIYLCHACSCQEEIEGENVPAGRSPYSACSPRSSCRTATEAHATRHPYQSPTSQPGCLREMSPSNSCRAGNSSHSSPSPSPRARARARTRTTANSTSACIRDTLVCSPSERPTRLVHR
jgi:hypothetical protein